MVRFFERRTKVTAKERIAELLSKYSYPMSVIEDVIKRTNDYYLSHTPADDNDPYLWQQVRYLENFKKFVLGVE